MKCFHNLFILLLGGLEGTRFPSLLVLEGFVLSNTHRHCRNAGVSSILLPHNLPNISIWQRLLSRPRAPEGIAH